MVSGTNAGAACARQWFHRRQLGSHGEDRRTDRVGDLGSAATATAAGAAAAARRQAHPGDLPLHPGPLHVAAALLDGGPKPLDRAGRPALGGLGVDVVQDHQMAQQLVTGQVLGQRPVRVVHDAGQCLAVDLGQERDRLGGGAGGGAGRGLQAFQQAVEPGEPGLDVRVGQSCAAWPQPWFAPYVGECRVVSVLPLPTYMCTPQGRQGSKLRTVRMMSTPLKSSGPFSSKMGWP